MDSKSKYLIMAVIIIIIGAVFWGYKYIYEERNYILVTTTSCDPHKESCFQLCENDNCSGDYYKKVTKYARNIPTCDNVNDDCPPITCELNEKNCKIALCSSDTIEESEICKSPADFETLPQATTTDSKL